MKDYKARRIIGNKEKHMVYYFHTDKNIPISHGWDSKELAQIAKENRHLSLYVRFPGKKG